jgi:3-hydroxyisobutyrate dehydrogenase
VNLLWFGQAVATAEALLLARRSGIDLDVLQQALGDSAAASSFIQRDLGALLSGDYLPSFGLDRCCEELAAINALAREGRTVFRDREGPRGFPCQEAEHRADLPGSRGR